MTSFYFLLLCFLSYQEEAGGKVTDLAGDSIECAANGAKLSESVTGIVVSCGEPLHGAVVQALQRVRQ